MAANTLIILTKNLGEYSGSQVVFILSLLNHYLDSNKLLLGCQSGFRSLHSTLKALLEATDAWSVNIDNGLLNRVSLLTKLRHLTPLITNIARNSEPQAVLHRSLHSML